MSGPHRVDGSRPGFVDAVTDLWRRVTLAGGGVGFVPADPVAEIRSVAEQVVTDVRAGRAHMLAIDRDHALLGFAVLVPGHRPVRRHTAEVAWLMVDPRLQGRGWGRRLLDAAVRQAKALGIERLQLSLRSGDGLEQFYGKCGWTERGRWPGAVRVAEGDERDDVWLTREV
jgi:GNAT superfamily N-acetyltransferase